MKREVGWGYFSLIYKNILVRLALIQFLQLYLMNHININLIYHTKLYYINNEIL